MAARRRDIPTIRFLVNLRKHSRHCERTRSNPDLVIPGWSEGPDPESRDSGLDASHRPGMTIFTEHAHGKSSDSSGDRPGPMPVWQGFLRSRRARALGLARSFAREPARAWCGLCDL